MKGPIWYMAACMLVSLFLAAPVRAAPVPAVGGRFPAIVLDMPQDAGDLSYLGLPHGDKSFVLHAVKARTVIVVIFNIYCHKCQEEAPRLKELYEKIAADPALAGKIKIIGIGVGNSAYEIGDFRKKYQIPFPLFPDLKFAAHKQVGEVRTPYLFGVKPAGDGVLHVFYSREGGFSSTDGFLRQIVRLSGLK
jgi:thiol-disulfide isomerase/thioredoxin